VKKKYDQRLTNVYRKTAAAKPHRTGRGRPSRCASSARRRADLCDPLAIRILRDDAEAAIAARAEPGRRPLRAFIAARSRIAEERAAAAITAGLRQIVVLGAGLDTLAYRLAPSAGLTVFEVDREATQRENELVISAIRNGVGARGDGG
jgi:methyltransferase (TIGR00027 family)